MLWSRRENLKDSSKVEEHRASRFSLNIKTN